MWEHLYQSGDWSQNQAFWVILNILNMETKSWRSVILCFKYNGTLFFICDELSRCLNWLQSAQLLAKPDLSPKAWVKKLVVLCDSAPQTPCEIVHKVLEQELGRPMDAVFERFDSIPLGSASVAQVCHGRIFFTLQCLKIWTRFIYSRKWKSFPSK